MTNRNWGTEDMKPDSFWTEKWHDRTIRAHAVRRSRDRIALAQGSKVEHELFFLDMENLLPMFLGRHISTVHKNTFMGATCLLRETLHADGGLDLFLLFDLLYREIGSTQRQALCAIGFRMEPAACLVRSICSTPSRHRGFGEVQRTLGYLQPGETCERYKYTFLQSVPENFWSTLNTGLMGVGRILELYLEN